jgi:hypothetical protein
MKLVNETMSREELKQMAARGFEDMVKTVVDVEREIIAVDAELHSDLEAFLLQDGSKQGHLWGINLYPGAPEEDFVEFDSMINVRPSVGNRSRGVDDESIRRKILAIISKRVSR